MVKWWQYCGLVLACAVLFAGCSSGPNSNNPPGVQLTTPVEDSTKPSSIGGTIFTLSGSMIDQAYAASVTLSGKADAGQDYATSTLSRIRGGYQFVNVPPGVYTVTAQAHAAYDATLIISGSIGGVRARGNIPTLMANVLVGDPTQATTLVGVVRQNGQPASGAIVSVDITAYTTGYAQGNWTDKVAVILSQTAGSDGSYRFVVPTSGLHYYLAAHSDTSMVANLPELTGLTAGATLNNDFALATALPPSYSRIIPDIVAATLPAPTADASRAVHITQLALARALHAPATRLAHLERVAATPRPVTRDLGSIVENDLYWTLPDNDVGVRGFHVYRAAVSTGPFTLLGSANDPYLLFFFDNDPTLTWTQHYYYTIANYAANGQTSAPSSIIGVQPLAPITVTGPADGQTVVQATAAVSWQPVPGALAYTVLVFRDLPTYNALPALEPVVHTQNEIQQNMSTLPAGTYWWTVSACNAVDPNVATAASYSAYRKMIITAP